MEVKHSSVTVSDGILQDTQSFSVTVNAVNDAPVAATGISGLTDEDQSIVISLSATDIDGDNLTYSLGNDGLNGTVIIVGTVATIHLAPISMVVIHSHLL